MFLLPSNVIWERETELVLELVLAWKGINLVGGACFVVITQWTEVLASSCNHFIAKVFHHLGLKSFDVVAIFVAYPEQVRHFN